MLGFSPEEAFIASTWNAAWASNLGGVVGGIDRGFVMDVVVFDASDYREIPYRFGTNLVDTVIKRGEIVVEKNKG
jgi:imidazolonepropionase